MIHWGSEYHHAREFKRLPPGRKRGRRKCGLQTHAGWCQNKRTHIGSCNGVALMSGCEWCVKRWARGKPIAPPPNGGGLPVERMSA